MDWVEVIWESIRVFLTMGNLLGIVAIIIAVRTLNFSKRSFIVKDSYDPLLRILKENKEIGIYDTIQYKIDLLLELKETYIYSAFEKKEKLLINEIIKNAKCGYCTNAEDYSGLADIIKKFSNDSKEERRKMALNSYNYYKENFRKEKFIENLLKIIKEEK